MIRCIAAVFLAGAVAAPAAAAGPAFLPGEVLVGGRPGYAIEGGYAYIQAYSAAGIYQRDAAQLWDGNPSDAVMLGNDVLFTDLPGVIRLDPNGNLSLYAAPAYPAGLAIDGQGNLLVGSVLGAGQAGGLVPIVKLDRAGHQTDSYLVASDRARVGVATLDLAADQCTLYYATAGPHIKRYDICDGNALPDLVDFGPGVFVSRIRVLSDGSILVTAGTRIVSLSPSGVVLKAYGAAPTNVWFSLSLAADKTAFWAGGGDNNHYVITKFDLNSAAVLAGPIRTTVVSNPYFELPPEFVLAVGERRAAQTDPAQIPALSSSLEIALILFLAVIALVRLR